MRVSLVTIPEQAVAGMRTQLRFTIDPADGLEKYLGAWAHMLAASNDLIDMMHQHPYRVDEEQMVEFEIVFPRPQVYRVWVQFQRKRRRQHRHIRRPRGAPTATDRFPDFIFRRSLDAAARLRQPMHRVIRASWGIFRSSAA